ncbi:MAG: HEAT repeat domain-containing protein, partial [Rubricoccaceae bacterium]|nr:HEAT repeat domain-containing protein [Rubricoccaceae bacterium]
VLLPLALAGCALFGPRYVVPPVPPSPAETFGRAHDGLLERPDLQRLVELQVRRRGDSLVDALGSPDPAVRARAAFALGSVQDPAAVPALLALLDDPEPGVRADAAFALGQSADSSAALRLTNALARETDAAVQRELLDALGKTGSAASLDAVLTADLAPALAPARALALARYGLRDIVRPDAVAWLAGRLTAPDPALREHAAYLFGRRRDTSAWAAHGAAVTRAFDALAPGDPARVHLASALGRLQRPDAFPLLSGALASDPDWRVRTNAARALGGFETAGAADLAAALLAALDDPSPHVAVTAAGALAADPARLSPEQAATAAAWIQAHPDRWRVAGALLPVLLHHDRAPVAVAWVRDQDEPFARALGLSALGRADDPRTLDLLFSEAADDDARVAYAALEALKARWADVRDASGPDARFYGAFGEALRRRDLATAYAAAPILADSLFWPLGSGALLREVYAELEAPEDIEPMVEIVRAAGQVRDGEEIPFLVDVAMRAPHPVLRQAAEEALNGRLQEGIDVATSGPEDPPTVEINWERLVPLGPRPLLTLFTERGPVVIELDAEGAPQTVYKLWRTAVRREYDGVPFHRVVPNFVVQGGDFYRRDGFGGPAVPIRSELTRLRYATGTAGMASAGKDTEGVQYFVTHSPQPHLDGRYTAFGRVVVGQEVVDAIQVGDRVLKATITPTDERE